MADDDTSRNADFVGRVVKNAKSPPETRVLTGWLGDAAEEGERRLYTNADLSCYIDIPTDAILHTEPIRDAQPAGCVFVWVKRDAALKPGGSASNRAARFLQGQVQEDFASGASPEAAGYRCITQIPCGEPTGFTGRCTKQPVVGEAWPCITAIPHCSEPTGFTGQCTHQPWPNPTRYFGCTIYHCPTRDLTHIQQICNIVATGMPGCPVVNPPEGGDPAAKEGAAAAVQPTPPVPVTSLPGCGYTQTWGLCPTLPPKCQVSVNIPCITQTETPRCRGIDLTLAAAGGGVSEICATSIGCEITIPCPSRICPQGPPAGLAFRAAVPVNTELLQCNPSAVDACPTRLGCNETKAPTAIPPCTQVGPLCPSLGIACTLIGPECPTYCGSDCQTKQDGCTRVNCTHAGPLCPTGQFECTQSGPQCPSGGPVCPTQPAICPMTTVEHICAAPAQPQVLRAAAAIGPTVQANAQCPTQPNGDCTFFGGCTPTPATVCTQIQCPTYPNGDCTFFNCPTVLCQPQNFAAAAVARPIPTPPLTIFVWQCHPPTPATHCFICPPITQTFHCGGPSAVDACPTRLCGR